MRIVSEQLRCDHAELPSPSNALLSPYDNVLINSYCHAWSCMPTYVVRHYGVA